MIKNRKTILIGIFSLIVAESTSAGSVNNILELKEKYLEYCGLRTEINQLSDEGKTIKAEKLQKDANRIFSSLFKPGKTYSITKDCPLVLTKEREFTPKCWLEDEFIKNNSSFEWYFEYVPVNWSNYSNFDFTSKSKKKFRTDLNNVEKLQEVKSTFTGKIQVGDNREIDRNGLRIMIKVLSINSTDE